MKWYCFEIKKDSGPGLYIGKAEVDEQVLANHLQNFYYKITGNLVTIMGRYTEPTKAKGDPQ